MKNLKLVVVSILIHTFLAGQLLAQLQTSSNADIYSFCAAKVPDLEISIANDEVYYNRSAYEYLDEIELLKYEAVCSDENLTTCPPGRWVVVPNAPLAQLFEKCKAYNFKIEGYCNGIRYESEIVTIRYNDKSCARLTSSKSNLTFYPQPASDILFVKNLEGELIQSVSILNMQGQKLLMKQKSQFTSKNSIELSDLNSGIYLVELQTNNGITHIKKLTIHSN